MKKKMKKKKTPSYKGSNEKKKGQIPQTCMEIEGLLRTLLKKVQAQGNVTEENAQQILFYTNKEIVNWFRTSSGFTSSGFTSSATSSSTSSEAVTTMGVVCEKILLPHFNILVKEANGILFYVIFW